MGRLGRGRRRCCGICEFVVCFSFLGVWVVGGRGGVNANTVCLRISSSNEVQGSIGISCCILVL